MQSPHPRPPALPPSLTVNPRLTPPVHVPLLVLLLMLGCGVVAYHLSERAGLRALADNGERQLELHAHTLASAISIHAYLPSLLELETGVGRLLLEPSERRRAQVNAYLEGLNQRSGSRAVYLLDRSGRVVATSNWRDADSFQGDDLSFRPYFQDAIQGKPGRFYGLDSITGEPGYYLSHGLRRAGEIIGVAVVKIRLDPLEERWQRAQLEAYVSDGNGIVILSSDPARRFKSVQPLDAERRTQLASSLQYHWTRFEELQPLRRQRLSADTELLSLPSAASAQPVSYLAQTRRLADPPWDFTLLSPVRDVRSAATSHGLLAAVAVALLAFLLIAWNERRKTLATRLAAREALEEANNQLERRIAERTEHLRASNERLKAQIRERRQAEESLRKTQDDLIQAGKLAVIGQMSTSIAHELNQPLAALRTLSGNTVRFLARGDSATASSNLQTINELVDHMGRITASLRAFARRSDDRGEAALDKAVDAALFLLRPRLERTPLTIHRTCADARLAIDQTRLEQILVNLIVNAIDALSAQSDRQLWLDGRVEDGHYRLAVRDNGPGIPPALRSQLFEPFFTTKPGEQGLGLGLTLSASLAAAAGGSLTAQHPDDGGTLFELKLPLLPPSPAESRRDA
ncbi:two-component system, sensor histidine kinase AauS [Pseudomonas linyingensis]|uniref:C4-dicarboxylate transport sensor protein DctB n=1 Tax=Pseudomonas linyingensis TaxID=915471 RepID=A0A1H6S1K4_9PSED|nr:ATP-binding protein [Pseudomonas linyingensis]SEI57920.1 two-component system, sensor histidine kinase AauS [Pseudomonas linyingensis]